MRLYYSSPADNVSTANWVSPSMNFYQQELLDHFHNPRCKGVLEHPSITSGEYNPSCGDSVSITAMVVGGAISDIAFTGSGCVISQATASMLCEYALSKSLDTLLDLNVDALLAMIKIPLGPTRLKCALLSLYALQQGIREYQKKESNA